MPSKPLDHQPSKPAKISKAEQRRLQRLLTFEVAARQKGYALVAGIDEAGRGPLAGPLMAAACIIPDGVLIPEINDSKQLTAEKRHDLYELLVSDARILYAVGIVPPEEIDRINIWQATLRAMLEAVSKLATIPDYLLVDGLRLPHPSIPCEKIIQGDTKSYCIAAASIIAKVTRDRHMKEEHLKWPEYGFERHKGYATAEHLEAIAKHGPCPIHRRSFSPFKSEQLKQDQLDFLELLDEVSNCKKS